MATNLVVLIGKNSAGAVDALPERAANIGVNSPHTRMILFVLHLTIRDHSRFRLFELCVECL